MNLTVLRQQPHLSHTQRHPLKLIPQVPVLLLYGSDLRRWTFVSVCKLQVRVLLAGLCDKCVHFSCRVNMRIHLHTTVPVHDEIILKILITKILSLRRLI